MEYLAIAYCTIPAFMQNAGMITRMHRRMRPISRKADGAFLCAEAWQSGLLHRAYSSAGVWASIPLVTSRGFETHRFHHQSSGTSTAATALIPIKHPGDEPEANDHLDSIGPARPYFQLRSEAIPSTRRMSFVNNLSRDKQIQIIACLTEGQSIRATERLTGIHRDTIMRLGTRVGRGCAELHDRMMVGVRAGRIELDEIWGYVGKKQKRVERHEISHKGDQYTFIGLGSASRAIISYSTGQARQREYGPIRAGLAGAHPGYA